MALKLKAEVFLQTFDKTMKGDVVGSDLAAFAIFFDSNRVCLARLGNRHRFPVS